MKIVQGSQVRVNVNLSLRRKPNVKEPRIAIVQAGVLVTALVPPANDWLYCVVRGWEDDEHPGLLFSEPDTAASIQARRGVLGWRQTEYVGYISLGNEAWYTVEDGPNGTSNN